MLRASGFIAGLMHRPAWCRIGTETRIFNRMQTAVLEFIDLVTGPSYLTLKERLAYATTMIVTMANAGTWSWLKWMANVKIIVSTLLVLAAFILNVWVAAGNRKHRRLQQELAIAEKDRADAEEERAKAEEARAQEIHRLEVEALEIANKEAKRKSNPQTEQDPE